VIYNLDRMRAIDDAWNAQDWASYESLLSPMLVAHLEGDERPHGRAEHVARAREFFEHFPGSRVVNDPYVTAFGEEERTCTMAHLTGRMTRPLQLPDRGVAAATQKPFDVVFLAVCVWRDGLITEQYEFLNKAKLFHQIGVLAAGPPLHLPPPA
jgi:hypothetical protein